MGAQINNSAKTKRTRANQSTVPYPTVPYRPISLVVEALTPIKKKILLEMKAEYL